MIGSFVRLFGDHAKQMEVLGGNVHADFFGGFSSGAFVRRLAGGHFELAADGAPQAFVGGFGALDHEEFARCISKENEHADLVLHMAGNGISRE